MKSATKAFHHFNDFPNAVCACSITHTKYYQKVSDVKLFPNLLT